MSWALTNCYQDGSRSWLERICRWSQLWKSSNLLTCCSNANFNWQVSQSWAPPDIADFAGPDESACLYCLNSLGDHMPGCVWILNETWFGHICHFPKVDMASCSTSVGFAKCACTLNIWPCSDDSKQDNISWKLISACLIHLCVLSARSGTYQDQCASQYCHKFWETWGRA